MRGHSNLLKYALTSTMSIWSGPPMESTNVRTFVHVFAACFAALPSRSRAREMSEGETIGSSSSSFITKIWSSTTSCMPAASTSFRRCRRALALLNLSLIEEKIEEKKPFLLGVVGSDAVVVVADAEDKEEDVLDWCNVEAAVGRIVSSSPPSSSAENVLKRNTSSSSLLWR